MTMIKMRPSNGGLETRDSLCDGITESRLNQVEKNKASKAGGLGGSQNLPNWSDTYTNFARMRRMGLKTMNIGKATCAG